MCAVFSLPAFAQPMQLVVSNETAPAGTTAQFKISLAAPAAILSGRIVMDFDPAVFGGVSAANAYSAAGDQWGLVTVQGLHVDAQFNAPSGGLGRLPGLPILTIVLTIHPGAPAGKDYAVTVDPSKSSLKDLSGVSLPYSIRPGLLHIGGSLSIQTISMGGSTLPANSVINIIGTGFNSGTIVSTDSVLISAVRITDPGNIELTLGGPAEMTGKQFRVENTDGSRVDYICALPVDTAVGELPSDVYPIFPLAAYQFGAMYVLDDTYVAVQNQNSFPVHLTYTAAFSRGGAQKQGDTTIPAGGYYLSPKFASLQRSLSVQLVSSAPVRMLEFTTASSSGTSSFTAALVAPHGPATKLTTSGDLSFSLQAGTAVPPAQQISVQAADPLSFPDAFSFTVSISTIAGGAWLKVTPSQGMTPATLSVAVHPTALTAGIYQAAITLSPSGDYVAPTIVNVTLQVTTQPFLTIAPSFIGSPCCSISHNINGELALILSAPVGQSVSMPLQVFSNGNPAAFSVTAAADDSGNWLSVSPPQGTTPSTITVAFNSANATGHPSGQIVIKGPSNSQVLTVYTQTTGGPPVLAMSPAMLSFTVRAGDPQPKPQDVFWNLASLTDVAIVAVAATQSGGSWLSATLVTGPGVPHFSVNVNPAGLAPGTYTGKLTFTKQGVANSVQVPVTLNIWSTAPLLSVTPSSLMFVTTANFGGFPANQTLTLTSGLTPIPVTAIAATSTNGGWLGVNTSGFPNFTPVTPAALAVSVNYQTGMLPGTYHGSITFTAPSGSVVVPVTLLVIASPFVRPAIGSIVNAASGIQNGVSPGEIVTIHGIGIGELEASLTLDRNGIVGSVLNNTLVLFDGIPAPILYGSVSQLNVITPYEVGGPSTIIEIEYKGLRSAAWEVPVLPTAPGVFVANASGQGLAAILNQDNTVNGPFHPAARGSVVQIYATGEGATTPAGVTGGVTNGVLKYPQGAVQVTIGGVAAQVQYTGSAPGFVNGLMQVNAVVPQRIAPGQSVPVVLKIGSNSSQSGVTLVVQ